MSEVTPTEPRRMAAEARDRVRFEEEALELSDQVYNVARRLVGSREEAEDLMQETYGGAFRSWRSYQPGTNLRAWARDGRPRARAAGGGRLLPLQPPSLVGRRHAARGGGARAGAALAGRR